MFPDVGVAEVRDAAIEGIRESLSIYGDQAAALAGALFDQLAAEHGYAAGSTVQSVIDDAEIERKVRYFAGSLASGNAEEFDRSVSDLTGYYVKRSAFENMVRNCERNGIRYARVPSGTETCAFCFMLSSRGFVYRSKASASRDHRTGDGYHRNCDCIVVPGFGDLPPDAQVEGYAPSEMYDRWRQCADTVGVDAEKALGSEELRRAVLQEVKTRDWRWLYTGKVPEITKDRGAKPFEKEKTVADILARNGFVVHFLKETNRTGVKTADALLNGEIWEFKIPEGWSKPDERSLPGEHTVRKQFYKALGKGTKKILLSNVENRSSLDDLGAVVAKVLESRDFDFDEALVVDSSGGSLIRIKVK